MKRYTYKGNIYTKIGIGKLKHPITGEWIDSIVYKNNKNEIFTREYNDFKEKFSEECSCGKYKKCTDNLDTCPYL